MIRVPVVVARSTRSAVVADFDGMMLFGVGLNVRLSPLTSLSGSNFDE